MTISLQEQIKNKLEGLSARKLNADLVRIAGEKIQTEKTECVKKETKTRTCEEEAELSQALLGGGMAPDGKLIVGWQLPQISPEEVASAMAKTIAEMPCRTGYADVR